MGKALTPALRTLKATGRQRKRDGWATQRNNAAAVSPIKANSAKACSLPLAIQPTKAPPSLSK